MLAAIVPFATVAVLLCLASNFETVSAQWWQIRSLRHGHQQAIDAHNKARQQMALGQLKCGVTAANMCRLTWAQDLADAAHRLASKCTFKHETNGYGQNLAMYGHSAIKCDESRPNYQRAVDMWVNEKNIFDCSHINKYTFVPATGHFTQVIWGNTCQLGCAMKCCNNEEHYVCNYRKAGNVIGGQIFRIGPPCPGGLCSTSN